MDILYYADLTRLAAWEGVAAGAGAILTIGAIAIALVAIGSLPIGLVSMPLAYALRKRSGLSDEENAGLGIFTFSR